MIIAAGTIIVAWLAADFLSGFWHWLEDRYFRSDWPIIGPHIAAPNKLHHEQPSQFLDQGYWSRNWTTLVPGLFFAIMAIAMSAPLWLTLCLLMVSQANEIHAWSHRRANRLIRIVQDTGFFASPRMHGQHHKAPFDCRYCVMSDFLNPVLDALKFWHRVEWCIWRVTGWKAGEAK